MKAEATGTMINGMNAALSRVFKRLHYPLDVMLLCVRWYVAYPLSLRNLEEMMSERGISVDHSTVHPSIELAGPDYVALNPVIHDVWTDVQSMSELLYRELIRPLEAGCFNSIPVTDPFDHFKRKRFSSRTAQTFLIELRHDLPVRQMLR